VKKRHQIMPRRRTRKSRRSAWERLPEDELLQVRLCDLGLSVEGSRLEMKIDQIYAELARNDILFRPHFWLSTEWFTPDGVPGVAMPFYLAHPRLARLEEKQMLELEGGRHEDCMQILRHEVGHAVDNAYRLHWRRKWREMFGRSSEPYPKLYRPKPYSKRFVLHLDSWYAQAHPSEDFAETFAVWLSPGAQWRKRYSGWPALKKLEYVDALMTDIAGTRPKVTTRARLEPLAELRMTLSEYYAKKRERYGAEYPNFYDRDLRRLFSIASDQSNGELASSFLRRVRPELRSLVGEWTGEYQYTIDQVLREMITRCRELRLRVSRPERQVKLEATILLTVQTMNYLHGGHHRVIL